MDALHRVVHLADWAKKSNRIIVLVAVDVKNAFNTISWSIILREVDVRGIPKKLLTLLENYFEDRRIIVRTTGGTFMRNVYEGLLMQLKAISHLNAVAFADDLAVILGVVKQKEATMKLSDTIGVILRRCADCGLWISREKTEVTLLTSKRIPKESSRYAS